MDRDLNRSLTDEELRSVVAGISYTAHLALWGDSHLDIELAPGESAVQTVREEVAGSGLNVVDPAGYLNIIPQKLDENMDEKRHCIIFFRMHGMNIEITDVY